MTDLSFDADLSNLDGPAWMARLREISASHGRFDTLGPDHFASLIEDGSTLIVSFETIPNIRKINPGEEPRGWSFVRDSGWSALTILASGETWFRDAALFTYFDELVDDGFFDGFERILFYGCGSGAYAAAAFSVAAPGSDVLLLQPAATLDPRVASWDRRFLDARAFDFTSRYGFAPDMIDAAHQVVVIHDPTQTEDAMHAALFRGRHVTQLRTPRLTGRLDRHFDQMGVMEDLLEATVEKALTPGVFARLWRLRQRHLPYLRSTLHELEKAGHYGLAAKLCEDVLARTGRPMFERRLESYAEQGLIPSRGIVDEASKRISEPAE